ncbi:MAG: hypothetical protein ACE3L7_15410 [Candidatus Pristimantibacillus sp.]
MNGQAGTGDLIPAAVTRPMLEQYTRVALDGQRRALRSSTRYPLSPSALHSLDIVCNLEGEYGVHGLAGTGDLIPAAVVRPMLEQYARWHWTNKGGRSALPRDTLFPFCISLTGCLQP